MFNTENVTSLWCHSGSHGDCRVLPQPEEPSEPTSALVPFLQRYADPRNKKPSVSSAAVQSASLHTLTRGTATLTSY